MSQWPLGQDEEIYDDDDHDNNDNDVDETEGMCKRVEAGLEPKATELARCIL